MRRFFSPGFQGTPSRETNGSPHSQGPQSPSIPLPCPHYTLHWAREGKPALGLGKTSRKAVTLAHSGCILPLPHTFPPPSLGEFQHEILARESGEFSLGPLEESLVPFISLFSPVHLPFPLKCSMKLTDSGSLLPCRGRVAQDDASMCGQTWVLFGPPFPCLENEFWIRRAPRPLPAPTG